MANLHVAYLVNQYPKVSHTFIRREIRALEAQGVVVERFSVRDTGAVTDADDQQEAERTHVLLRTNVGGAVGLATSLAGAFVRAPLRTLGTARMALRLGGSSDRGRLVHLAYLAEAASLLGQCKRRGVTHVHAHFGTNSTTVALLCEALGGPGFSFTAHGPEEFDKPDLIALSEKIARSRFAVGVSSFGRSQLLRRTDGRQWEKIKVVPCGVDASFLDAHHQRPITASPRLVCVGRICEQKGQLLLLQAAADLVAEGIALELVLVGDGEMRAQAEQFITAHGLKACVRITGWADGAQVREELLAARAMVLPSFAEGLPVVIMEALALRRPVISTYVAGIPELVQNDRCGWLVPAGDVPSLRDAMRAALAATPRELDALGAEGHRRVAQRHDADKAAALLRDAFVAAA